MISRVLDSLLYLAPLLVLLVPLLRGRFLGERTIQRLRERTAAREHGPRPARELGVPRRAPLAFPRGGNLIASSLAVRPPPLLALT